mgnify:FL=1
MSKLIYGFIEPRIKGVRPYQKHERKSELRAGDEVKIIAHKQEKMIGMCGKIVMFARGGRGAENRMIALRVVGCDRPIIVSIGDVAPVQSGE